MTDRLIMLPTDPEFNRILATPPPDPGQEYSYIVRPGAAIQERVTIEQLDEYLLSGEYDERLQEIDRTELLIAERAELEW